MKFATESAQFDIGGAACGDTCSFENGLTIRGGGVDASGTVAVSVALAAPPVPEPSTWATLLLGFAGLGFAGYRHTRKNRAARAAT
jgi:hypothetical protein